MTGYPACCAAYFGSGFLFSLSSRFYFATAKHVLSNHGKQISDLRIPEKLGSHEVIPQLHGIRAVADGMNDYEDLLLVELNGDYIKLKRLESEFFPLTSNNCHPKVGEIAVVVGFPEELQEVDVANNRGTYQPATLKGKISSKDETTQMLTIGFSSTMPLKSFNQLSGAVVYSFDSDKPQNGQLAGIVLQGGRGASLLRALDARCLFNLANYQVSEGIITKP